MSYNSDNPNSFCFTSVTPIEEVRAILSGFEGKFIKTVMHMPGAYTSSSGYLFKEFDGFTLITSRMKRKKIDYEIARLESRDPQGNPTDMKYHHAEISEISREDAEDIIFHIERKHGLEV